MSNIEKLRALHRRAAKHLAAFGHHVRKHVMRRRMKGKFIVEHFNKSGDQIGTYAFPNGIKDLAQNYALDASFRGGAQISTWYLGLIDTTGFSTDPDADTMASHAGWTEADDYTEANRVEWVTGAAAGRAITNPTTAEFSVNATVTLSGLFVTSDNTKNGTTGTLWSTALFASTVTANNGDTLKVTYSVTA